MQNQWTSTHVRYKTVFHKAKILSESQKCVCLPKVSPSIVVLVTSEIYPTGLPPFACQLSISCGVFFWYAFIANTKSILMPVISMRGKVFFHARSKTFLFNLIQKIFTFGKKCWIWESVSDWGGNLCFFDSSLAISTVKTDSSIVLIFRLLSYA